MKFHQKFITIIFALSLGGCTLINQVTEPIKVIWGSSTRALEAARAEALSKTYHCEYNACYDAVLEIVKQRNYEIFINERARERMVIMGITGNVNTTEVGIFFDKLNKFQIQIDISSLSSTAKENVAKVIFEELDKKFQEQK